MSSSEKAPDRPAEAPCTRRDLLIAVSGVALASLAGPGLARGPSRARMLAPSLDGRVVMRGDADYEAWRQGLVWQSRKPNRGPAIIVRPNTVEAICDAVRFARVHKLKVAVKSAGHNLWANFLRDDGMLIDMWNFRKVEMAEDGQSAWIEPSVWSRDIMLALGEHGRAFPAAHCASVGMGGFLLGGGVGLNWDNWGGLSAHSVLAAEVVTADGKLRLVDDANSPDLAWALRGAGNGFPGIVTRFKVKTYPAPKVLKASTFFFPLAETAAAVAWVRGLAEAGRLPMCEPLVILAHNPAAPPDAAPEASKVCVVRINAFTESAAEAERILAPLASDPMAARAKLKLELQDWSFEESFYSTLDFRVSRNFGYFGVDSVWTSQMAEALPVLAREFAKAQGTASHVVMSLNVKGINPANAAARMHGQLYIGIYSVAAAAADGETGIAWLRSTAAALAPFAAGRYINEVDMAAGENRVASCFTPQDFSRIATIRAKHDPDGLFHGYFGING